MSASFFAKARELLGGPATEPPASARPAAKKKMSVAYHAVSIMPGHRCCAAAQDLRGQRFLSREAPALPLKECDRADCSCRYEHFDDRRAKARRARDMGVSVDGWLEEERRKPIKRGRRTSDR